MRPCLLRQTPLWTSFHLVDWTFKKAEGRNMVIRIPFPPGGLIKRRSIPGYDEREKRGGGENNKALG